MANENSKDFNAMLLDSKDMPKIQTITDTRSIAKHGGDRMYFAPPIDYDKVMKRIPCGKVTTIGSIREYFAKLSGADFTEPITAGIFVSIAAWASHLFRNCLRIYHADLQKTYLANILEGDNVGINVGI